MRLPVLPAGLVCVLLAACGGDAPSGGGGAGAPELPAFSAHQPGVTVAEGVVTGSVDEGCADCHEEIVAAYARSGMHEALTLPTGAGSVEAGLVGTEVVDEETGIRVRFDVRGGRYEQTVRYVDPTGVERVRHTFPVDLVIGSGAVGRSYLAGAGRGFLMLPLSWFREAGRLTLSPGPGFHTESSRAAQILCVQCHTGDVAPFDPHAPLGGFRGGISLGVGCSRCHGDGAQHGVTGDPRDIVNPARLDLAAQNEVCFQCHWSGAEQFFAPGRDLSAFRPGEPLARTMGVFEPREKVVSGGATVAGHVVRLRRSLCFTASDGELTCTTCHNPHRPAAATDAQGCGVCHAPEACGTAHDARGGRTCAECHMPRTRSVDIEHASTTDHWIRRRPEPDVSGAVPEEARLAAHAVRDLELVNVLDPDGGEPHARLLEAHAYLAGFEAAANALALPAGGYLERAERILDALLAAAPDDPEVLWRRARAHRLRGRAELGVPLLERALRDAPDHAAVIAERGIAASVVGDAARAVDLLRRAVAHSPDDLTAVHALSQTYERAGAVWDALGVLHAARRRLGPRLDLAAIGGDLALRVGALDDAIAFGWDRLVFRSRDPDALAWQGNVLRLAGRLPEARAMLGEALRLEPDHVDALVQMAEAARAAGDEAEARRLFERAHRLAPDHPAFRPR